MCKNWEEGWPCHFKQESHHLSPGLALIHAYRGIIKQNTLHKTCRYISNEHNEIIIIQNEILHVTHQIYQNSAYPYTLILQKS